MAGTDEILLIGRRIDNYTGDVLFHEEKKGEGEGEPHGSQNVRPVEGVEINHLPFKGVRVHTKRLYWDIKDRKS